MRELRWYPLKTSGLIRLNPVQLELPLQFNARVRWVVQEDLFSQDRYQGDARDLVANETIASIFAVAALSPDQEFVLCTKHIGRKLDWFEWIENDESGPVDGCLYHLREIMGIDSVEKEIGAQVKWPLKNVTVLYFMGKVGVRCE